MVPLLGYGTFCIVFLIVVPQNGNLPYFPDKQKVRDLSNKTRQDPLLWPHASQAVDTKDVMSYFTHSVCIKHVVGYFKIYLLNNSRGSLFQKMSSVSRYRKLVNSKKLFILLIDEM